MNLTNTFNSLVDKVQGWVEALILLLPNLVAAVLIVLAGVVVARIVRRVVSRLMDSVSSYRQVNGLIATVTYVAVLATGVFIALEVLSLSKAVTTLLAGAGILGLALGFAFQDIAANFISGVLLAVRRPFVENDIVETNGFLGVVEHITLRSTEIRTFQGQIVIIPNKEVFQSPLVNFSRNRARRVDVECGVAYGDDLETASQIALDAVRGLGIHDDNKPVDLYYDTFGDSSINFTIRFWIDFTKQTDFLGARSKAIIGIKKAFDRDGITIPFPIRTLDFGVVGGEKLNQVLPQRFYTEGNGQSAS